MNADLVAGGWGITRVSLLATSVRFKWWRVRNHFLEIGIHLLFATARPLNEQFYLRYRRQVLEASFDMPNRPSHRVLPEGWSGWATRGLWVRLGRFFPWPQLNDVRLRGLLLCLMLATMLKNRFYAMNEERRGGTQRTARFVASAGCIALVYLTMYGLAASLLPREVGQPSVVALLVTATAVLTSRGLERWFARDRKGVRE